MKIRSLFVALSLLASPNVMADVNEDEFATNETNHEGGFLTEKLNEYLSSEMDADAEAGNVEVGRKVTDFASAPKFGGYFMSGYYYSGKDGAHSGDGFKQKNVRAYVSGTLFKDFSYLMQVQIANDKFHMKDYWLEWKRYSAFQVKAGQFIRVFGYENPYNPFEYHDGAYAQITQKLCGQADYVGEDNGGGRDQGIQVQGDLFPVGKDKHHLLHYQVMVSNGQTINSGDKNSQKDISGMIAIQPVQGLRLAVWGWTGNFTGSNGVTVDRDRYMFSVFYDKNDWTFRSEYVHSTGHSVLKYVDGRFLDRGKQQGWYVTAGIPCNKWLKTWVKYDSYEEDATVATMRSVYSVSPNIQLHKNLWFQPRVAYVHDRNLPTDNRNYCEASVEMGVRF